MATKKLTKAERIAQTMKLFAGTWQLAASAHRDSAIEHLPDYSVRASVSLVLFGTSDDLLSSLSPSAGLTLSLNLDQTFDETAEGDVKVPWATVDGVLAKRAQPFSGVAVVPSVGKGWLNLRPAVTETWLPKLSKDGPSLRYDDGDTQVYDCLTMHGDTLLRSVHVATDSLSLRRIALSYVRAGAPARGRSKKP